MSGAKGKGIEIRDGRGSVNPLVSHRYMRRIRPALVGWMFLLVFLAACGSSGDSADPSPPPPLSPIFLNWDAPSSYVDGTPLDLGNEMQCFEIFVKEISSFGPEDTADVWVGPMDTTFNLTLLDSSLTRGVTYYVSVRAVTMSGAKSDFSPIVSFSL